MSQEDQQKLVLPIRFDGSPDKVTTAVDGKLAIFTSQNELTHDSILQGVDPSDSRNIFSISAQGLVTNLRSSADGKFLIVNTTRDISVYSIRDLVSGTNLEPIKVWPTHSTFSSADFSKETGYLAFTDVGSTLHISTKEAPDEVRRQIKSFHGFNRQMKMAQNFPWVLGLGEEAVARLFNLDTGKVLWIKGDLESAPVSAVTLNESGAMTLLAYSEGRIEIIDNRTKATVVHFMGEPKISKLWWSPDGRYFVVRYQDKYKETKFEVWSVRSESKIARLPIDTKSLAWTQIDQEWKLLVVSKSKVMSIPL